MPNREILFRGFSADENGNYRIQIDGKIIRGEWVEGFPFETGLNSFIRVVFKNNYGLAYRTYDYCVVPSTVSEFTGLTDKNNQKGFAGDKIIDEYRSKPNQYGIIKYDNYNQLIIEWNFKSKFEGKEYDDKNELPMRRLGDYSIIGTIFDVEVQGG